MKLVDSQLIAKAEGLFRKQMRSVIDLATIGSLFRKKYNMRLSGEAQFQNVDVVEFKNEVAFRFDYQAVVYISIYMDRAGNFLGMEETTDPSTGEADIPYPDNPLVDQEAIRDMLSRLVETIAAGIKRETFDKLIQVHHHSKLAGRLDFMGARFTVYQNQPVYNLIYQGEIALSFLINQNGKFLDFGEPLRVNEYKEDEAKSSDSIVYMDIDELK